MIGEKKQNISEADVKAAVIAKCIGKLYDDSGSSWHITFQNFNLNKNAFQ